MLKEEIANYDYANVISTARIALYDDFTSSPRIIKINPAETLVFIENLTTTIYEQAKLIGGTIPYSIIREVAENFIHAYFQEIVVSIFDNGNTIRFTDQGPGIPEKEHAQYPGFSSAIEPMKNYIRGVGSGLPIVCDYLHNKNGSLIIEDNLTTGAVVTISLTRSENYLLPSNQASTPPNQEKDQIFKPHILLNEREQIFLTLLLREGALRITDLSHYTETNSATTYNTLERLRQKDLVEIIDNKKRQLTDLGKLVAQDLNS